MRHEIIEAIIAMFNCVDKSNGRIDGVRITTEGESITLTATNNSSLCTRHFKSCGLKEVEFFKYPNFIKIGNKDFLKALLKEHKKEDIPRDKLLQFFTVNDNFPATEQVANYLNSPELVTKKINADLILLMAKAITHGKGKDKHHIELSFLENGYFKVKGLNSIGIIAPLK